MRALFDTYSGYLRDAWVIPYGIFAVLVLAAYARFLLHLPPRSRWLMLAAGACYVVSSIGLEMVDAEYDNLFENVDPIDVALYTVEELLEMSGIILFIYALLSYSGPVRLSIAGNHTPL